MQPDFSGLKLTQQNTDQDSSGVSAGDGTRATHICYTDTGTGTAGTALSCNRAAPWACQKPHFSKFLRNAVILFTVSPSTRHQATGLGHRQWIAHSHPNSPLPAAGGTQEPVQSCGKAGRRRSLTNLLPLQTQVLRLSTGSLILPSVTRTKTLI